MQTRDERESLLVAQLGVKSKSSQLGLVAAASSCLAADPMVAGAGAPIIARRLHAAPRGSAARGRELRLAKSGGQGCESRHLKCYRAAYRRAFTMLLSAVTPCPYSGNKSRNRE